MSRTFTSVEMAGSINTNPVIVRRIVGKLKKAGLIESIKGTKGGFYLSRTVQKITLWDIYSAVEGEHILAGVYSQPNPACPVGRNIGSIMNMIYDSVDETVKENLQNQTLSDILDKVKWKPLS